MYTSRSNNPFWFPTMLGEVIADSIAPFVDEMANNRNNARQQDAANGQAGDAHHDGEAPRHDDHHFGHDGHRYGRRPGFGVRHEGNPFDFAATAINIIESADSYRIEVAAAGMKKEDLSIKLTPDNELEVSVAAKDNASTANVSDANADAQKTEAPAEHYIRRDFGPVNFTRTFCLPDDVDTEKISAHVENGILTVTLAKKQPVPENNVVKEIAID